MAEQILQALQALYRNDDQKIRDQAGQWLEQWQQTSEAWSVSDKILHDPTSTLEAQYFCAQTLRTKVQRDFDELPPEAVGALRESLILLLLRFGHGPPPVKTQLCLAMAALAAHWPQAMWGEGVVRWFAGKFSTTSADIALPCMLELLTVLPQEAGSHKIAIRPERRRQFLEELKISLGDALDVLCSCLAQPGERIREQVLEAFGAWLKLTEGQGVNKGLLREPLVMAALEGLKRQETFFKSVDAVCELVWVTVDPNTCAINVDLQELILLIVGTVMGLRPRFTVASARIKAEQEGKAQSDDVEDEFDDDLDTAKGMARLFAEVGEAYIQLILEARQETYPPVEALLDVAAFPDLSISSISFNFWYKLSRQLDVDVGVSRENGEMSVDVTNMELLRRREFFAPAFKKLVELMRGRVRYPNNYDNLGSSGKSDFKRDRHDIGETLVDAARVLGPVRVLEQLIDPLREAADSISKGVKVDWRAAEAALYCVRTLSRYPPPVADPLMEQILNLLPALPQDRTLRYTSCLVLGAYSDWLNHSLQPGAWMDLLGKLVQWLILTIELPEATSAAATSIRHVCDACGTWLQPYVPLLMQLYTQALSSGAVANLSDQVAGGRRLLLHEDDVQQVLEGVCVAVSRCIPEDQLVQGIGSLVSPVVEPLQKAMSQWRPGQDHNSTPLDKNVIPLVDRLATVFRTMGRPVVAADILIRVWPIMDAALNAVGSDTKAVERLCRALRYGLKAAGRDCSPLLPALLEKLPGRFQATRHSAFMYVVSELVKIFGPDPASDASLGPILARLLGDSCEGMKTLADMDRNPDLVDDTFLLGARALHYCPRLVICPQLLPLLLERAMLGTLIQHKEACCSVLTFWCRLFDGDTLKNCTRPTIELMEVTLAPKAPILVRLLLAGVAGALPLARTKELTDTLLAILKASNQQGVQWLATCMALIPDSSATPADRSKVVAAASSVVQAPSSETDDNFEVAIEELGDLCRRNRRSRQAAQEALVPPELAPHIMR